MVLESSSIEQRSSAIYDPQVPTEFCSPSSRDCRPSWDWNRGHVTDICCWFYSNLTDLDRCILINCTLPLSWHWNWQRMQMMPRHEPWACSCGVSWRQGSCPGNLAPIYPQHCCPSEDSQGSISGIRGTKLETRLQPTQPRQHDYMRLKNVWSCRLKASLFENIDYTYIYILYNAWLYV